MGKPVPLKPLPTQAASFWAPQARCVSTPPPEPAHKNNLPLWALNRLSFYFGRAWDFHVPRKLWLFCS